jgi:hypothetical protein
MKLFLLIAIAGMFFTSCTNGKTAKTFCDTTCSGDSIQFKGSEEFQQTLSIGLKNCLPDTLTWTNNQVLSSQQLQLGDFLGKTIKINKSAVACAFQDTVMAWLSFNDCITGRGYLLKLPFAKGAKMQKISSALNSFDPKFSVDPDLRAYTDGGNIFVANVKTGKEDEMTFKVEYPVDYDNIHTTIDSINVTKQRIFVRLLKEDGSPVTLETKIDL